MATATESAWTSEPFRLGPREQFSRARELLMRAGFEETPLCARASVNSIYEFPRPDGRSAFKDITDAQSLFVRLFIDGDQVARSVVESILSPDDLQVLEALGLIHPVRDNAELRTAAVAIYPVEELYIASDRRHGFESTHEVPPSDLVFSPMTRETRRFLRLMPRESCDHLVDVCTGTGIAGLVAAARFARRATLVDIAGRSVRFAEFNAALNGLTNVRVVEGDVYAPLGEERFDVVIAHPPYVPALQTEFVFRDAGEDGEQVTRRLEEG